MKQKHIKWNPDSLAACLQKGEQREPFLAKLQAEFETKKELFDTVEQDNEPTRHALLLVQTVREVAKDFFALPEKKPGWYSEANEEKWRLLKERRK